MIAAQSVNFIERFIVDAGHTAQRVDADYGYDLYVSTFDEEGYCENGVIYVQIKATDNIEFSSAGTHLVFDLTIRDYNLWVDETMPVLLVLFDAQKRRAWWLNVQRYFAEKHGRRPQADAKTVRVSIPAGQKFGRRTIRLMRTWKQDIIGQLYGRIRYA